VQSLPLARSTFTPLGAAASLAVLVTGAPWCDVRALDPPGFPDAHPRSIALMGATRKRWPGSPRGSCVRFHVIAFEGDRASSAPSGPYAGLTRLSPAPSASELFSAARVRSRSTPVSRRRAAVALLGVAPPEPSSGPVLGPSCPARSPRACARASRCPGSLTLDIGGEPVPSVLREVHEGGVPASAVVDVRRRRPCRLSAAVPDPHDLRPGLAPFAWSPGC
jgi:hypothetical protein